MVKILSAFDPLVSGINSADEEGWVPLHSAASSGNVEIVELLLTRGELPKQFGELYNLLWVC